MRYTDWASITRDQENVVGSRLADMIRARTGGGLDGYNFQAARDAALAELLAMTGEEFNVKSFGAKGDGVTDDTAAIEAAQNATGSRVVVFPPGQYVIDSTIALMDHRTSLGSGPSPNANNGTEFIAGPNLGTNPMFEKTSGNLTRGGFYNIRFTGTDDADGGDCISISGTTNVADFWTLDNVQFHNFTGSGLKIVPNSGSLAGNPLDLGFVKFIECGQDGTSYGLHIERLNRAITRIRFLSGDNNGAGLLYTKTLNSWSHLYIGSVQSERTIDAKQNNIITVDGANAGFLNIEQFWVLSNVTGGSNANAFIREQNGTTLRFKIGQCYHEDRGSNVYSYGFDDGTTKISAANFVRKTFMYQHTHELYEGSLVFPRYTTSTRPAASVSGRVIYNTATGALNLDNGATWDRLVPPTATKGITASTTQAQGQQPLTTTTNVVSTVANTDDVVTLPDALTGLLCEIRNDGANQLQIFPASGDKIDGGAQNASATLAAGATVTYRAVDATEWYSF
jgi:Pectate lyase superfamily protein